MFQRFFAWSLLALFAFGCAGGSATLKQHQQPVGQAYVGDCVPSDGIHPTGYLRLTKPPEDFNSMLSMWHAVQAEGSSEPSKIEVDYIRVYAHVAGRDSLLDSDEYDDMVGDGGLYLRHPSWFYNDDHTSLPCEFDMVNGYLVLRPSDYPDRVFHWWNSYHPAEDVWRVTIPDGATNCWAETRIRITGPAYVQGGIDYWRSPTAPYGGVEVNNREACMSNWTCSADPGWQTIVVGKDKPQGDSAVVDADDNGKPKAVQAPVYDPFESKADGLLKKGAAVCFVQDGRTYFPKEIVATNKYSDPARPKNGKYYLLGGVKPWAIAGDDQELRENGDYLYYPGVVDKVCQVGWEDPADASADPSGTVWSASAELFSDRPGSVSKNGQYGYLPVNLSN